MSITLDDIKTAYGLYLTPDAEEQKLLESLLLAATNGVPYIDIDGFRNMEVEKILRDQGFAIIRIVGDKTVIRIGIYGHLEY